jgi:excisionase family DNA binding protein
VVLGVVTEEQVKTLHVVVERLQERGLLWESEALRKVLDQVERPKAGLSTGEAARLLHVTPQTIRNWVRAGVLAGWKDTTTGHVFVSRESLIPALVQRRVLPDASVPDVSDAEIAAEIAAVRTERRRGGAAAP